MIITCQECSTRFLLDDDLIKPDGSKVRCSLCQHVFTAFPAPPLGETPKPEAPPPLFDEPQFQNAPDFEISQGSDFSMNSDSDGQSTEGPDLEDPEIDFSEIEFDDPQLELDSPDYQIETDDLEPGEQDIEIQAPDQGFDEDGLDFEAADFDTDAPELDASDFEFEEPTDPIPDPGTDTADIEISFDRENEQDEGVELESLPEDIEDSSTQMMSAIDFEPDDTEPDTKEDEPPAFEFDPEPEPEPDFAADKQDEDPAPDLPFEPEESQPENDQLDKPAIPQLDIKKESSGLSMEDPGEEDLQGQTDELNRDGQIDNAVLEQDKFAEYDKVLDQETEPKDSAEITIRDTEEQREPLLSDTLQDQGPLITPPSAHRVRQKRGSKKKKGISLPVKILLILFLLVLAAYVAIIRLGLTVPMVSDLKIPYVTEWLQPKPILKPVPEEASINGRYISNKSAGDLFVITGRVINPADTAVSYIQVRGSLLKKDTTTADELIAYCGNVIPEETLKSGNILDITKQMGVKQGNQNTNVNIKPGASVMFMLVFANLSEDLSDFTVAVHGFEPAEK